MSYKQIHELARLAGTTVTDPKSVTEAQAAEAKWDTLRREPAPTNLATSLADLPPAKWEKTIAEHAQQLARHTAIQSANQHTMTALVERATRAAADDYLAQLAPTITTIVDDMIAAAANITTRDAAESIARMEGEHLHAFNRGITVLGGYAALCATIIRSRKSDHDRGLTVFGELAVIHPGTIPAEVFDRDNINKRRTNPDDEAAIIDGAKSVLRAPRAAIADTIADTALGANTFNLKVPASSAEIGTVLEAWDQANAWRWL